jgi:hypothetical protein
MLIVGDILAWVLMDLKIKLLAECKLVLMKI